MIEYIEKGSDGSECWVAYTDDGKTEYLIVNNNDGSQIEVRISSFDGKGDGHIFDEKRFDLVDEAISFVKNRIE